MARKGEKQPLEALKKANAVRQQRANMKTWLKTGEESIELFLTDPPDYVETMKIKDLLLAIPGCGPTRVANILRTCRMGANTEIGNLEPSRREEVLYHTKRQMHLK